MFRNESEVVIEKAKAREKLKAKSKGSSSRSATPMTPASYTSSEVSPQTSEATKAEALKNDLVVSLRPAQGYYGGFSNSIIPSYNLQPTLQERALGYFYSNPTLWLQNNDLLCTLCGQADADEHLLAGMSAVGLASLAKSIHAPSLMVKARKDYLTAIRLINSALRSPSQVKKDSTLFAVMVLSMFETITGTDVESIGAWTKHVNGAAALVKLRGMDQFYTDAGQRMYTQVMGNLVLSCLQRTVPVPPEMIELRKEAGKILDKTMQSWKLMEVIIDFTTFRSTYRRSTMGRRQIVETALDIDRRFAELDDGFPKEFSYRTLYTDKDPDLIWNGTYHKYENNWTPQIRNWVRVCRIMAHETISNQLLYDSAATPPILTNDETIAQRASSNEILLQAQADILASVPQYTATTSYMHEQVPVDGTREWYILWPLYLVGAMDLATDQLRGWVINRLLTLADSAGIAHAQILARHLILKQDIDILETPPIAGLSALLKRVAGDSNSRIVEEI
ncbi:uncharacterized protein BP5553_06429 [Venustampulla echinocandica]|uniref:Uncharacterized protein n=1 Tax=Venustampulla echinocandica TaxID=2656787 RepID=A0A370TJX2_9HELO|nr:uncharacterized protein BP5553_06429 [Venustampulla echinocandica]RDL35817.1 hypothetical protein BP5553_06429 [Venustampulla echinocandica]